MLVQLPAQLHAFREHGGGLLHEIGDSGEIRRPRSSSENRDEQQQRDDSFHLPSLPLQGTTTLLKMSLMMSSLVMASASAS